MKNLIWLASYPKSGNTWLRAFLSNLHFNADEPVSISQMIPDYWANDNRLIERFTVFEPSELTDNEILRLRPEVYKQYAITLPEYPYIKTHAAFHSNDNNIPVIPLDYTSKVIYVVRNPLDVVVSFAYHQQQSFDQMIDFISDSKAVFGKNSFQYNSNSFEVIHSWTNHVKSWLNSDTDLLIVKYEEMKLEPLKTFISVAKFLELDYSQDVIEKAIAFSDFNILKEQEFRDGFSGKNLKSNNPFFRKGIIGSGIDELSIKQKERIRSDHEEMMKYFNY